MSQKAAQLARRPNENHENSTRKYSRENAGLRPNIHPRCRTWRRHLRDRKRVSEAPKRSPERQGGGVVNFVHAMLKESADRLRNSAECTVQMVGSGDRGTAMGDRITVDGPPIIKDSPTEGPPIIRGSRSSGGQRKSPSSGTGGDACGLTSGAAAAYPELRLLIRRTAAYAATSASIAATILNRFLNRVHATGSRLCWMRTLSSSASTNRQVVDPS